MGDSDLEKLREQALRLPDAERAELAHDLVKSLDEPIDPDAGGDWDREIARRLDAVDAGTAKLIDREEFRQRLQARLQRG
jgi:putative addiction module component (TIGR02574 family)